MNEGGAVFKTTKEQKHGAQSEVFQRQTSPMGFLSRAAPTTFTNDDRFTAAHNLNGNDKAGAHVGEWPNKSSSVRAGAQPVRPIDKIHKRAVPPFQHVPGTGH